MKLHKKFLKELNEARNIAIFIHEYPDGDAIGSSSALYFYLKNKGKKVELFSSQDLPKNMKWVDCFDEYKSDTETLDFDLGVVLDCSERSRIGACEKYLDVCGQVVRVDHHPGGEQFSTKDIVDSGISSACELVASILSLTKKSITKQIADSLLFGILTDTNSFKNANTRLSTLKYAAMLMEKGAELNKLEDFAFASRNVVEVEATKEFYKNLILLPEKRIGYSYISNEMLNKIGAKKEDLNGHANIIRNIDGIDLAFVAYELEPNYVSGSLRSKAMVATNEVASKLGGGGHLNASGFRVEGKSLKDVVDLALELCVEEMKKW